jgi:hypothetical protein
VLSNIHVVYMCSMTGSCSSLAEGTYVCPGDSSSCWGSLVDHYLLEDRLLRCQFFIVVFLLSVHQIPTPTWNCPSYVEFLIGRETQCPACFQPGHRLLGKSKS